MFKFHNLGVFSPNLLKLECGKIKDKRIKKYGIMHSFNVIDLVVGQSNASQLSLSVGARLKQLINNA